MTVQMRSLGIAILVAIALALLLVSGIHAAQVISHAHVVSAARLLADTCPSSTAHC